MKHERWIENKYKKRKKLCKLRPFLFEFLKHFMGVFV